MKPAISITEPLNIVVRPTDIGTTIVFVNNEEIKEYRYTPNQYNIASCIEEYISSSKDRKITEAINKVRRIKS
jgi:hypothetical protein